MQFFNLFQPKNLPKKVKTPTILQMESVECGPASLGIILAYYGKIVPLAELRTQCGVSRDGSKASNLIKAANNYGLKGKGLTMELQFLKEMKPPFIVFWNFNHFLVVEGYDYQNVFINDPAVGRYQLTWSEFDISFTGVILTFEPTADFKKGGKKRNIIWSLVERLQGSIDAICYCFLSGFLAVIPGLTIPVFSQIFIDQILIENRTTWIRPFILGLLFTTLLQAGFTCLQLTYLRKLNVKLSVSMSSRFFWHVLSLPIEFYAQRFTGEISSRVKINNQVAEFLSGKLLKTIIDVIMVIFYVGVMFAYDRVLTVIGISFALINVFALQWIARERIDTNLRFSQAQGKAEGVAISGLESIETIKSSALESDFFSRLSGHYTKAFNAQQELEISNQFLAILPPLLTSITTLLVLIIGGLRVMEGYLSMGMLIAFQGLMSNLQTPINTLVGFGSQLQELEGNLTRLDDVLENPVDPQVIQHSELTPVPLSVINHIPLSSTIPFKLKGYLEFRDVTFGYAKIEKPLIKNLTFSLTPGRKIAFVGGSGSGKSTIAKLITGLYTPWSGEILFDDFPRSQIPRSIITNSLSMVEQDIFLFGGTIRDNLTLWDSTIPYKQLVNACEDALIWDIVKSIPGGLEGQLSYRGANLSGGQRQRLEIARALLNQPSILVMDEATSALDTETEKRIDQNLYQRGCTCVIIAHRLSTIRDCDEIIVLDRGVVVQRGSHEQLKEEEGYYARLISLEH